MVTNEPPSGSIIQQIKYMIIKNNFDLSFCEPYVTHIELDMTIILKAYESAIDVNEKLDRLRLHFKDLKLRLGSSQRGLVIAKDECILLNEK